MAQTDNNRLILIFTLEDSILPIARYVNSSEINDLAILHRCVVVGDKKGFIHVL